MLVTRRTRLSSVKGRVIINRSLKPGLIRIGFSGVALSTYHEWNVWNINGDVLFESTANFGTGTRLYVGSNGKLIIGDNFLLTAKSEICCAKSITIGKDVLFSWDVLLMDTDSHPIRNRELQIINNEKEIEIGNNVWIGCRSTILKGSIIPDDSIIAANSLTHRRYKNHKSIIGGNPAIVLMTEVVWGREHF
jgi:acetyltransferase-like isoleucine patch superfamily enzyme